jgi:hypothetical protein
MALSISAIAFVSSVNGRGRRKTMDLQVTVIMIGVEDLTRSKRFYAEGLGCTIEQDYPNFVSLSLG